MLGEVNKLTKEFIHYFLALRLAMVQFVREGSHTTQCHFYISVCMLSLAANLIRVLRQDLE